MAEAVAQREGATPEGSLRRQVWTRLLRNVRAVVTSEVGARFRLMFTAILLLLLGINGMNVVSSYVGRDLMTAIEQRDHASFWTMSMLYIAVFGALTAAAVL